MPNRVRGACGGCPDREEWNRKALYDTAAKRGTHKDEETQAERRSERGKRKGDSTGPASLKAESAHAAC